MIWGVRFKTVENPFTESYVSPFLFNPEGTKPLRFSLRFRAFRVLFIQ